MSQAIVVHGLEKNCLALATMDSIWSSSHRCKQRHKRPRYYKTPVAYYSNSIATQTLLILSGDISVNPGPVQTATSSTQKSKQKTNSKRYMTKCDCCEKTIKRNQASITCWAFIGSFHLKCSGLIASSSGYALTVWDLPCPFTSALTRKCWMIRSISPHLLILDLIFIRSALTQAS